MKGTRGIQRPIECSFVRATIAGKKVAQCHRKGTKQQEHAKATPCLQHLQPTKGQRLLCILHISICFTTVLRMRTGAWITKEEALLSGSKWPTHREERFRAKIVSVKAS